MIETGVRQLLMYWAIFRGKPINPRVVEDLVQDGLHTLAKFGTPGDEVEQLLAGPFAEPDMYEDALQGTIRYLTQSSPYYQQVFSSLALRAGQFTLKDMPRIPLTTKQTLQQHQQAFICKARDCHPYMSARTVGSSGPPAEIWIAEREARVWAALEALTMLLSGNIAPQDCLQVNISSRATASVQQIMIICRLLKIRLYMLGIIAPDESLDNLLKDGDDAPTLLSTCPSYLGQLVAAARRRKLGPQDFHLRQITCRGEVLSSALAQAAQAVFGPVTMIDTFEMTEVMPLNGHVCDQGHLHYNPNTGFVEVLDLVTGQSASPDTLGTLVITPYYPYRECTPVFRYDTCDVVRTLPDQNLTCNQNSLPATSRIMGRAERVLRTNGQVVTERDIVEILDGLPLQSLPSRFSAQIVDHRLELLLPKEMLYDITAEEIEQRFQAADIVLSVKMSDEGRTPSFYPLHADLAETTFSIKKEHRCNL